MHLLLQITGSLLTLRMKICWTILITAMMLPVIASRGRGRGSLPDALMFPLDMWVIRDFCFRDNGSWRPLAKWLLILLLAVAISCVWLA